MRTLSLVLATALLTAGCKGDDTDTDKLNDADGDGYTAETDCDDADSSVNPGADEVCNGVDDDCDDLIDEDVLSTFFVDGDRDGYGDPTQTEEACDEGDGLASQGGDCDDADPSSYPGADELCDGVDNDCDSPTDEGVTTTYYTDADADGYGDPSLDVEGCELADGLSATGDDCDDSNPDINPAADETCDTVDNDCDGSIDEAGALGERAFYADTDGDTYGDAGNVTLACTAPEGYVTDDQDCDDLHGDAYPGAPERCDTYDNDCDASVDEPNAIDAPTWYADADGDTFGVDTSTVVQCAHPGAGWAIDSGDCDDSNSAINPGATELCDGSDNDCDGTIDEGDAADAVVYYPDLDGDHYGDLTAGTSSCSPVAMHITTGGDCDDVDPFINPAADEECDHEDNDCDGTVDESDAIDATAWYYDGDRDNFGAGVAVYACSQPASHSRFDTDCDDTNRFVNPDAHEYCDGTDTDCDGVLDNDPVDGVWYYRDADGDTYGDPADAVRACTAPAGYVTNSDDCDDTDPLAVATTVWYYDSDGDGHGGDYYGSYVQCESPGYGWVTNNDDCDEWEPTVYPGAPEICVPSGSCRLDGLDNDCDGTIDEGCPTLHVGDITADETWSASETHLVACDVRVEGLGAPTLTIADGATVQFMHGASLFVGNGNPGTLDVQGTTLGVTMTSGEPSPEPGDWGTLYLGRDASASTLEGLTVEYGGGYSASTGAVHVYDSGPALTDVTITDSEHIGLGLSYSNANISGLVVDDAGLSGVMCDYAPCFDDLYGADISGSGEYPMRLPASEVEHIGAGNTFGPGTNTADQIHVAANVITGSPSSPTVAWGAQDVPYLIDGTLRVQHPTNAPILVLEDGVDMVFSPGSSLYVGYDSDGDLIVQGTSDGVTMSSSRPSPRPGDWGGVNVFSNASSLTDIEGLTLSYASDQGGLVFTNVSGVSVRDSEFSHNQYSGVYQSQGSSITYTGTRFADNGTNGLTIWNNSYSGYLNELGGAFTGNVLTGNGAYPLSLPQASVRWLDTSSTFTGNTLDQVAVTYDLPISQTSTWHDLGVPYLARDTIHVGGSSAPILTLEDGVDIQFTRDTGLWVGTSASGSGDLVVDGTTEGVTLTSTTAVPGSWYGLLLGAGTSPATNVYGATIEYAGSHTSYRGGVYVETGYSSSSFPSLEACTIQDNKQHGVYVQSGGLSLTDSTVSGTTASDSSGSDGDGVHIVNSDADGLVFSGNALTGNDRYPAFIPPTYMTSLDAGSTFTGNGADRLYVQGGTVGVSGTWADLGVPWYLGADVTIRDTVSTDAYTPIITVGAAEVEFAINTSLYVGSGGTGDLVANGTLFTSGRQPTAYAGDWNGLYISSQSTAVTSIRNSTVSFGGRSTSRGNIYVYYASPTIQDNTLTDSSTYGITCTGAGGATISGNTGVNLASGDQLNCPGF